jgi:hypothetical protein
VVAPQQPQFAQSMMPTEYAPTAQYAQPLQPQQQQAPLQAVRTSDGSLLGAAAPSAQATQLAPGFQPMQPTAQFQQLAAAADARFGQPQQQAPLEGRPFRCLLDTMMHSGHALDSMVVQVRRAARRPPSDRHGGELMIGGTVAQTVRAGTVVTVLRQQPEALSAVRSPRPVKAGRSSVAAAKG